MKITKLNIKTKAKTYPIFFGNKILGNTGKLIRSNLPFVKKICVIADKKTSINQILWSLLGQSEHSSGAQSILITKEEDVINKVRKEIPKALKNLPRKKIATKSIRNNCIMIKAKNDKNIIELVNEMIQPEHLEINCKNHKKYSKYNTMLIWLIQNKI